MPDVDPGIGRQKRQNLFANGAEELGVAKQLGEVNCERINESGSQCGIMFQQQGQGQQVGKTLPLQKHPQPPYNRWSRIVNEVHSGPAVQNRKNLVDALIRKDDGLAYCLYSHTWSRDNNCSTLTGLEM